MLIEFKVGNFLSFKDMVTLSMVASPDKEHRAANTIPVNDKLRLLKSAAIYGANAAGKSNLFKAMDFMRDFVVELSKESLSTAGIPVDRFRLSTETDQMPAFFEIIFLIGGIRYRYGFQVDEKRVQNEWLFHVPTTREATLFTREKDAIKIGSHFKEGKGLEEKTRPNALFLSVAEQFNGKISKDIMQWFNSLNIISTLESSVETFFTASSLDEKEFMDFTVKLLEVADIGIKGIKTKKIPIEAENLPKDMPEDLKKLLISKLEGEKKIEVNTIHQKFDKNNQPASEETFSLNSHESAGTKTLFAFSAPIYYTLKNNLVLVIDELTSKLHPLLTRAIVEFFHQYNSCKGGDAAGGAQLIFASHDTSILSRQFFRRDQVWFTQKDKYGATDLYSLEEYRVRKDATFNKDYIMGKYGAIPFIGDIDSLFNQSK